MTGILDLTLHVQQVEAQFLGTITIGSDGSVDPPTAPIQRNGNLLTLTDDIANCSILVYASNIVIEGAGHKVQGPGNFPDGLCSQGICLMGGRDVTIRNIEIRSFYDGIYLYTAPDGGPEWHNNNLTENTLVANQRAGVWFMRSSGNILIRNTFVNNGVSGFGPEYALRQKTVEDNTVNGRPLVYLQNVSDYAVHDAGQVVLVDCNNIQVENLSLSNTTSAIELHRTRNSRIANNSITNTFYGICLEQSTNNSLENNVLRNNRNSFFFDFSWSSTHYDQNIDTSNTVDGKPVYYWVNETDKSILSTAGYVGLINCTRINCENLSPQGFLLAGTSNSTISRSNITNACQGLLLFDSQDNNIVGNSIAGNSMYGILILEDTSHNNSISRNNIVNNYLGGIIDEGYNNSIVENNIADNGYYGFWDSSDGTDSVYHNNFMYNKYSNLLGSGGCWDNGYPSGGNYWSDYEGKDLYSGPHQNETGSDSIGDTPYTDPWGGPGTDRYPLMGPWTIEGQDVTANISGTTIKFSNITLGGVTTVNTTELGYDPPQGFRLVTEPPLYYDIKTTANYSELIMIGMSYNDTGLTLAEEKNLKLMHWNETLHQWKNITTYVDTENNMVYGETTHISTFTIMKKLVGDVDWDGDVDIVDVVKITSIYASKLGDLQFNPNSDLDNDGTITILDVVACTTHYGQRYP
jgi:parallel beta-helix repeat protein